MIERKVDRLIFNVENSVSATGGDAIDALKITPAIRVQNDAIAMVGKNKLAVMVDDRVIELAGDDLINFLKTIRVDDIKNIEVITNPPAKYDAEGNSGLVNIRLKKAKLDMWNVSVNSSYKQSTYPTFSNGGSFNYQKKKLSFFTNINDVDGSKKGLEDETIQYAVRTWKNEYNRRVYSTVFSGRAGLDYQVSDHWAMGAQYLGSLSKPQMDQNDHTVINANNTPTIESLINSKSSDFKKLHSNAVNLHSLLNLNNAGKNISFDLDYFNLDNNINRNFQTQNSSSTNIPIINGYQSATNLGIQDINMYSARVDLMAPLKWMTLSYGGKVYLSETNYDNQYFDTTTGAPVFQANRGKTTLMKMLLKFYKPTQGDIFFNSVNVKDISPKSLRENCGVVMQDGFIFSDTIKRNVVTGDENVREEKLQSAIRISNIEGFIESLPLKYNTKIGASGNGISGGQKQRILIARAVYKDPHYLFFDEATSALDAENEKKKS